MTITAKKVKDLTGFRGNAALYQLNKPIGYDLDWDTGEHQKFTDYVVVSAANVPFSGPETYIFPASEDGEIADWGELPGSLRGTLSHSDAISNAGWEIV